METNTAIFSFANLAGSAFEIGKQQGLAVRQIPPFVSFLSSVNPEWSERFAHETEALIREYCPGLEEEIHGLADGLGVGPEKISYVMNSYLIPPRCSHMVILPDRTADGHTLVARSYEFGQESNDNRLCLTRANGFQAHIGASSLLLGRLDGMNESGLSVTMSAGGIPVGNLPGLNPPPCKGLAFWMAIRSALDTCVDVPSAVEYLRHFPHGGNPIILLADSAGRAARLEVYGRTVDVELQEKGSVLAANHFQSAEMLPHIGPVMRNSRQRLDLMRTLAERPAKAISVQDLRTLLGTEFPDGLACHFYKEWFGTLHSLVYDLTTLTAWYCMGSPVYNNWHRFTLAPDQPPAVFPVQLSQAEGFETFWG
jgi:predicted choloylglycine hydrolase